MFRSPYRGAMTAILIFKLTYMCQPYLIKVIDYLCLDIAYENGLKFNPQTIFNDRYLTDVGARCLPLCVTQIVYGPVRSGHESTMEGRSMLAIITRFRYTCSEIDHRCCAILINPVK